MSALRDVKRKVVEGKEAEDEDKPMTIKDIEDAAPDSLSHQSTWMLLKKTGAD